MYCTVLSTPLCRSTGGADGGVFAALAPDSALARDDGWQSSRFGELERFVYEFLLGGKGVALSYAFSGCFNATSMSLCILMYIYIHCLCIAFPHRLLCILHPP